MLRQTGLPRAKRQAGWPQSLRPEHLHGTISRLDRIFFCLQLPALVEMLYVCSMSATPSRRVDPGNMRLLNIWNTAYVTEKQKFLLHFFNLNISMWPVANIWDSRSLGACIKRRLLRPAH